MDRDEPVMILRRRGEEKRGSVSTCASDEVGKRERKEKKKLTFHECLPRLLVLSIRISCVGKDVEGII